MSEIAREQAQNWANTMSRLARVRDLARQDKNQSFTNLMHHLTPEVLKQSFYSLKRRAATGVDGLGWYDYEFALEERLRNLHQQIHKGPIDQNRRKGFISQSPTEVSDLSVSKV